MSYFAIVKKNKSIFLFILKQNDGDYWSLGNMFQLIIYKENVFYDNNVDYNWTESSGFRMLKKI